MKVFILCLIMCFFSLVSMGEEKKPSEVDIQKALDNISSLQSDFNQIYSNKSFGGSTEFKGKFYLKKPGKIRWDYLTPEKKVVTTNGKTFWLYKKEDNQVLINKNFEKERKNQGISFLWGDKKLDEVFKVSYLKAEGGYYTFDLTPITEIENVVKLQIWVNSKNFIIEKVLMNEVSGNTNLLVFSKIVLNGALDDKIFNFNPPKGTEIIIQKNEEDLAREKAISPKGAPSGR